MVMQTSDEKRETGSPIRAFISPTVMIGAALLIAVGCGETQPEPEVSTPPAQNASSLPEATPAPSGDQDTPVSSSQVTRLEDVPRMPIPELRDLIEQDAVQVVDVRSGSSYMAAHIPGSINIPVVELRNRLDELATDRLIVTYCT